MNEPKKCTAAIAAGVAAIEPIVLTPEECAIAAEYLHDSIVYSLKGGLEGDWELPNLRNLLNAQHKLQLMGDGAK